MQIKLSYLFNKCIKPQIQLRNHEIDIIMIKFRELGHSHYLAVLEHILQPGINKTSALEDCIMLPFIKKFQSKKNVVCFHDIDTNFLIVSIVESWLNNVFDTYVSTPFIPHPFKKYKTCTPIKKSVHLLTIDRPTLHKIRDLTLLLTNDSILFTIINNLYDNENQAIVWYLFQNFKCVTLHKPKNLNQCKNIIFIMCEDFCSVASFNVKFSQCWSNYMISLQNVFTQEIYNKLYYVILYSNILISQCPNLTDIEMQELLDLCHSDPNAQKNKKNINIK